ncbi:MAG TPA: hypothetical protein VIO61_00530 [Anaerolineaceae bacterium]
MGKHLQENKSARSAAFNHPLPGLPAGWLWGALPCAPTALSGRGDCSKGNRREIIGIP